jgi:hypothetical protein
MWFIGCSFDALQEKDCEQDGTEADGRDQRFAEARRTAFGAEEGVCHV